MDAFAGLLREAMLLSALLCLPVLAVAAFVGTAIALVQAATQIQEQTLTLLPKMIAVGFTIALFGAFALRACEDLFHHALAAIPLLVYGP
jgi:flagellar biosynthetic protein FliQ